jgi:hypothetical protein
MKSASNYDYRPGHDSQQKQDDDWNYIKNGADGWWGSRWWKTIVRDWNAPANAATRQDLDDATTALSVIPTIGAAKGALSPGQTAIRTVAATEDGTWAKINGMLRDASRGKGNFGLGSATYNEAIQAGKAWVGEGFRISKDGSSWISANGLRQFRPPSFKPKLGIQQANFQWRNVNSGAWQGNGHLDIIHP